MTPSGWVVTPVWVSGEPLAAVPNLPTPCSQGGVVRMGLIRQVDHGGELPGGADGGIWTRCTRCRIDLGPLSGCEVHPDAGVDIRILTAARLTHQGRATVEAQLLALVWDIAEAVA